MCPFGALQDFIAKIVPERFQRDLPQWVHDKALWVKYGILAIVVTPAIIGSSLSLFGYFEPFGTVFYWSTSVVLWLIAGGFLVASAIVPRFYCRYACPLGASLAIVSVISPFRIKRVEQCNLCKVCQHACPTGAIRGPDIDFKECVRCNTCETLLIEKAGVCKHDMATIQSRLVKLPMAG
jgi:polyferredoxin